MIRISAQSQVAFKATHAAISSADVVKRRLKAISCAGYFQLGKVRSHCRATRREFSAYDDNKTQCCRFRSAARFSFLFFFRGDN